MASDILANVSIMLKVHGASSLLLMIVCIWYLESILKYSLCKLGYSLVMSIINSKKKIPGRKEQRKKNLAYILYHIFIRLRNHSLLYNLGPSNSNMICMHRVSSFILLNQSGFVPQIISPDKKISHWNRPIERFGRPAPGQSGTQYQNLFSSRRQMPPVLPCLRNGNHRLATEASHRGFGKMALTSALSSPMRIPPQFSICWWPPSQITSMPFLRAMV